jgi:hypothetical protein
MLRMNGRMMRAVHAFNRQVHAVNQPKRDLNAWTA